MRVGGRRRPPVCAIDEWNLFNRCDREQMRADNTSDCANDNLNNQLERIKPDLWSLVAMSRDYLRKHDCQPNDEEEHKLGRTTGRPPKSRPWAEQASKLRRVLDGWGTGVYATSLDYLYAIAVNLDLQQRPRATAATAEYNMKADDCNSTTLNHLSTIYDTTI
jgi:hypothetical protein